MANLETGAVGVSPNDSEPVTRLELSSNSKCNHCGEIGDHEVLVEIKK